MFSHLRKVIVAVVGLAAFLLYDKVGIDMTNMTETIVEIVISALTAFGVWKATNEPNPA